MRRWFTGANSARNPNTVSVQQEACPGDVLRFSTCSVLAAEGLRDHYIRLYLEGTQVAFADQTDCDGAGYNAGALGMCGCAKIDYTYTGADCGTLVLELGCYASRSCQKTATVDIDGGPTAERTA
ncbi:hypothetical protein B484DRAFT_392710, partial [Ochromonadaceae sp. CCMP2298]